MALNAEETQLLLLQFTIEGRGCTIRVGRVQNQAMEKQMASSGKLVTGVPLGAPVVSRK